MAAKNPDDPDNPQNTKEQTQDQDLSFNINSHFAFITFIILLLSFVVYRYTCTDAAQAPSSTIFEHEEFPSKQTKFNEEMKLLIEKLDKENSNMNFVNRTLHNFVRVQQHEKPSVILLLAADNSSCALCHLAWYFANSLIHFYDEAELTIDYGNISAKQMSTLDENDAKLYIEEQVDQTVTTGGHWVIMEDIDKFPVSSLSKVQVYLDQENPPHKNIVYIVTSVIRNHKSGVKIRRSKDLSDIAQKHFDVKWSHYEEGHRRALMGRMASVIGLLNEENSEVLNANIHQDSIIHSKCEYKCNQMS